MTDDPWRNADPAAPVHAPSTGYFVTSSPVPQYAPEQPVYAPEQAVYTPYGTPNPYQASNPYQAPLPKRGGYRRLFWILGTVGLLVLGGCGVGIYFAVNSVSKDIHAANAFLSDVRSHQFTAAYQRLCSSEQSRGSAAEFAADLQSAAARGHGVTRYNINSANTSENFGSDGSSGTSRTASGTVTFASGDTEQVTLGLRDAGNHLCVSSGYEGLF
jgi:hypothetical protein